MTIQPFAIMRRALKSLALGVVILAGVTPTSHARDTVAFRGRYPAGSIVVLTGQRQLFYVLSDGRAVRYPVGVGRAGMAWQGRAYIDTMLIQPAWTPPADIKRANPGISRFIPGGSPRNPMGDAVLGLNRGNYAIHGTNNPSSIGRFVSHGCIRMYNQDIRDLYRRVNIGTQVFVLP
jgi:lipoprotein-anchoring transpeptidase ErfK/SrfK